jgi:hypothetical protein
MRPFLIVACLVTAALAQYPSDNFGEVTLGRDFGIQAAEFGGAFAVTGCAAVVGLAFGLTGTHSLATTLYHPGHSDTMQPVTNAIYGLVGLPLLGAGGTCFIGKAQQPGGRYWATALGAGIGNVAGFMLWSVIFRQTRGWNEHPDWTVVPASLAGLAAGALAGYNLSLWNSPGFQFKTSRLLPPSIDVGCSRLDNGSTVASTRLTFLRVGL